jgi:hypothetical protein
MDFKSNLTLVATLLFLLLASKPAFTMVAKVTDNQNMSLVIRALLFALLFHMVQGSL